MEADATAIPIEEDHSDDEGYMDDDHTEVLPDEDDEDRSTE